MIRNRSSSASGQWVGPFEFDRILGRENREALAQGVADSIDGHAALLHCLEQRRLGLRRRPVDLVTQDEIAEERAGPEGEFTMAG